MQRCLLVGILLIGGCLGQQALAVEASGLVSDLDGEASVVARRGSRTLLRGQPSLPASQTDERPSYAMRVEGPGAPIEAPGRVLGGALTRDDVVFVTTTFELIDGQGAVLDRNVLPELAVSADGDSLAVAHAAGEGAGVYVLTRTARGWSTPRLVTRELAWADRPLWLDDGRLVVVGAVSSGIAGVWLVEPTSGQPPSNLTNGSLRTGRPFGPTFVPPPAYHASMRVVDGVLVYDDGRAEQQIALAAAGRTR